MDSKYFVEFLKEFRDTFYKINWEVEFIYGDIIDKINNKAPYYIIKYYLFGNEILIEFFNNYILLTEVAESNKKTQKHDIIIEDPLSLKKNLLLVYNFVLPGYKWFIQHNKYKSIFKNMKYKHF